MNDNITPHRLRRMAKGFDTGWAIALRQSAAEIERLQERSSLLDDMHIDRGKLQKRVEELEKQIASIPEGDDRFDWTTEGFDE